MKIQLSEVIPGTHKVVCVDGISRTIHHMVLVSDMPISHGSNVTISFGPGSAPLNFSSFDNTIEVV